MNKIFPLAFTLIIFLGVGCIDNKKINKHESINTDSTLVHVEQDLTNSNLTDQEKKSRDVIQDKLKEELADFELTYKPLDYGNLEEYYLEWISPYRLNQLAKEQNLDVARDEMEKFSIKVREKLGDRNQDNRKGLRVTHKFQYRDSGETKTGNFMFYLDSNLSKILHIEKLNSVQLPI